MWFYDSGVFVICGAGADVIITYYTPQLLSWLNE